jgi:exopolysaccharide biosynthesis polyprenyl glycosylphosphotransferase
MDHSCAATLETCLTTDTPTGSKSPFPAEVLPLPVPPPPSWSPPGNGRVRGPLTHRRPAGVPALLLVADLLCIAAAGALVGIDWDLTVVVGTVLIACRTGLRMYRRRLWLSFYHELPRALASSVMTFGVVAALALLQPDRAEIMGAVGTALTWFTVVSAALHALVLWLGRWVRVRFSRGDRTLVVGTDKRGMTITQAMTEHPEFGLRPVGFVDPGHTGLAGLPLPCLDGELGSILIEQEIRTVVLVPHPADPEAEWTARAITANRLGVRTLLAPLAPGLYRDGPDIERLRSHPLVRFDTAPTQRPSWMLKRAVDIVVAAAALVVLAPLIIAAATAVLLESGRPVIFRQDRVGLDGRVFRLFKFRSMRPADEQESQLLWTISGDPRIGKVGRFLRRTSIDELPQLWNVLRGDMSLVGPRPERPSFVDEFTSNHDLYWARHRVPAGLTGLAQINGLRGNTSISDRARYDNYYIANWSLWLDVRILLLTGREAFRRGDH